MFCKNAICFKRAYLLLKRTVKCFFENWDIDKVSLLPALFFGD